MFIYYIKKLYRKILSLNRVYQIDLQYNKRKRITLCSTILLFTLLITCKKSTCSEFSQIDERFPYKTGEIVKFKTSTGDILTSQVEGPHYTLNNESTSTKRVCRQLSIATWKLIDKTDTINCELYIEGLNGGSGLFSYTPVAFSISGNFYNPRTFETATINGISYNDIIPNSDIEYGPGRTIANMNDSVWISQSKGFVKLKYNGKTYEREL